MAKIAEINDSFKDWLAERPKVIQDLARDYPPDELYHLSSSGHRVTIASYSEDGTVTVNVSGQFNAVTFERSVFGIDPKDLEPCEIPTDDEPRGVLFEGADADAYIETLREGI